ncbi:LysR family transcriptional regulator [Alteromonas facilis]|uniref:LysR family transcriptional regulator n=1 Tax=Alteromonas facilis TaxID=2048004 RepID=UPI000C28FB9F|nr:LysR family transcriptional regulator [Alteromonas facilis]
MKNWDDFQLLLALKRANTLRGAAKILGVNHSTVSRRLNNLHQRFNQAICRFSHGRVTFTELGLQLVRAAEDMDTCLASHLDQIQSSIKQLNQQVNLSIPPAILQFVLMQELHEFQARNPELTLSINATYTLSDLEKSEADVVIRASAYPDEHLVGHRLYPISLGYFAHKDYFNKHTNEEVCWITANTTKRPSWLSDTPFPNAPLSLSIGDLVMRHQAASDGMGMIRGAHYIARCFPNLVEFAQAREHYADLWILTHPTKKQQPNVKRLIRFLLQAMRGKQNLIDCTKSH